MELDSGTRLVANGTRVGEIFTAAGSAFQKIGELAMILYGNNKSSRKSIPSKTEEKVRQAVRKFATEIESITGDIRKKTGEQIKSELKRKNEEELAQAAELGEPSTSKQKRSQKATPTSSSLDQGDSSLTEAERIMARADAEQAAILAGIATGMEESFPEGGVIVEEEIITTEPEDGSMSDNGPVRGIGVAGSGESSSGDEDQVDPSRPKKRSKKRKVKREAVDPVLEGLRVEDEEAENQVQHHALIHAPNLEVGLEEAMITEEEVVYDGLELQFAVTEEIVTT